MPTLQSFISGSRLGGWCATLKLRCFRENCSGSIARKTNVVALGETKLQVGFAKYGGLEVCKPTRRAEGSPVRLESTVDVATV